MLLKLEKAKEILKKHEGSMPAEMMSSIIEDIMANAEEDTGGITQEQLDKAVKDAEHNAIIRAFFSGEDPATIAGGNPRPEGKNDNEDYDKIYSEDELVDMIFGGK